MAALYHLSRAQELRDLAKRLEGPLQRNFTLSLFRAARPLERQQPHPAGLPVDEMAGEAGRGESEATNAQSPRAPQQPSSSWTGVSAQADRDGEAA